ncbi:Nitrogen regulation protein NtrB [hydrothermal vent metagenome]|uniref:Sensory histidine kinase/phosphatase NtrB n=1 Tax=hydrothermal vent metagenome TaxID=652676 RepID=A0A3B1BEG0_9ZZZZ
MNADNLIPEALSPWILENLSTVVLLFDEELCLQYINPAGEMMFAASVRNLVGQKVNNLIQSPNRDLIAGFEQAVSMGTTFTERAIRLRMLDEREITVDCTVLPLVDSRRESGILVELQQLDRQLRISREEHLISQHHAARDLIRGLAHEIKNPLGGLRGAAQLLEHELPDPALQEYTQVIIDEADRLQTLVNRMLGPNKLPKYREVNIHQVLDRVRSLVQAESGGRTKLALDFDPSIPDLYGDFDQLIQAILNIVRNAARAASDDGLVTLRTRILRQFSIGNDRHKLVVQIEVVDNGPGISADMLQKIFYPMVSASEEGMGLGLSIAQSLISQHGGLIECNSKPGETVFTVLLPLENPNA